MSSLIYELPPALSFPVALSEVRRGIEATSGVATTLMRGLDDAAVNWRPAPAAWSIAQCLDHLAVAARQYGASMTAALDAAPTGVAADPGIAPGRPSVWFVRQIEPPPRRKSKAPSKIVPAERRTAAEALGNFLAANREVCGLLDRMATVDPNRVRFVNPLVPLIRFTVGTGVVIVLAHNRRHLWQAHNVRNAPGFPTP